MLPETLKIKAEYYQANRVYVQKVEHNMQELQTVLAETKGDVLPITLPAKNGLKSWKGHC